MNNEMKYNSFFDSNNSNKKQRKKLTSKTLKIIMAICSVVIIFSFFAFILIKCNPASKKLYEGHITIEGLLDNAHHHVPAIFYGTDFWFSEDDLITKIELPYDKTLNVDIKYNAGEKLPVNFGLNGRTCVLTYIANNASIEYVKGYSYSGQNNFCASKQSDVFHKRGCRYVKQISDHNIIYFPDPHVAILFGYRSCDICEPDYIPEYNNQIDWGNLTIK